ncbi:MAG: hypothetical protein B6241_05730 [Spirochaetaceae bacterium 4572_59]|nr:MAG: hypothetical protein B6241_05730 [Spirochaetaceae bacterium 4572_59]
MSDKKEIFDMFEGPVRPVLIRLSLPILAGMFFQLLYNIVDTIFVSRIDLADPSYVGGVGLIFPLVFLFIALGNGLSIGVSSLVARAIGEKNHEVLDKTAESGFLIGIILSILTIVLVLIWGKDLVSMLGATGDYYTHGYNYLIYLLPSALFIFTSSSLIGILQGEGLMKHVMNAMILGTVINIILDPILIFLLNMDVRGAALATAIGQGASFIYVFTVFLKNRSSIRIEWKISNISRNVLGKIVAIGLPQAMGMIMMAIATLFYNRLVVQIDPLAMTAFSLFGRLEQLVLMPGFALGAAVITMVGQNAGRGRFDRIRDIMYNTWLIGISTTIILALLMMAAASRIYPNFSELDTVVDYAVRQTYTMELLYIFALTGITNRNFFQGIGSPVPALLLTLLRTILLSLPLAYLYVKGFGMGIEGVWWGMNTGTILTGVFSIFLVIHSIKRLEDGSMIIRKV